MEDNAEKIGKSAYLFVRVVENNVAMQSPANDELRAR